MKALLFALILSPGASQANAVNLEDTGVIRTQFVSSSHWAINRNEAAKALRTKQGQKWILINLDADQADFHGHFMHEVAHHVVWDQYGEDVLTHGPEFRAVCRQLVEQRKEYFCGGK